MSSSTRGSKPSSGSFDRGRGRRGESRGGHQHRGESRGGHRGGRGRGSHGHGRKHSSSSGGEDFSFSLHPGFGAGNELVDIGINLNHPSLFGRLQQVLDRSASSGVSTLIITGTSFKSSKASARLVSQHYSASHSASAALTTGSSSSSSPSSSQPIELWYTCGIHPHDASSWFKQTDPVEELTKLCSDDRCVAVGECGLDFNRMFSPQGEQERCFEAQLEIANRLRKPLFLHERDAFPRFLELLRKHRTDKQFPPAVVHCFTGSKEALLAYLEEGCYIGITGWVSDPRRGKALLDLIPLIPLDRLMIETDAPFLTPFNLPHDRPRTNEPCLLPYVAQQLAEAYHITPENLAKATTANARRFFNLDRPSSSS